MDFSLHGNARTTISIIPFFETDMFFVPNLNIRSFFGNPSMKTMIAFVVVQVDNIVKVEGGVFKQLTIAYGPSPLDRAMIRRTCTSFCLHYTQLWYLVL